MNLQMIERIQREAESVITKDKTIREVAREENISKSSVHKDLQIRLKEVNYDLFLTVQTIFQRHIEMRHIKGGEATKEKYKNRSYKKCF